MKRFVKYMHIFLGVWMLVSSISVYAYEMEDSEMRIEQVRICMPDIKTYFYPKSEDDLKKITVTLQDEKLEVKACYSYEKDENGIDYYLLLDISKSIGNNYFSGIKQAVLELQGSLKKNDTLSVITFGDQVSIVEDRADKETDISSIIEGLQNNNDNTHLFEALDKTAQLADRKELMSKRAVAIVITDGEDCSTNESTKNEALEKLQKAGLPLYSMTVKQTASGAENVFINDFMDFTRAAGGKLLVFEQDEAINCIQQISLMLQSAYVLELKASSNRLQSVMQPLTITTQQGESKSIQVCPHYSQEDDTAPKAKIKQTNDKKLVISFSEPVLKADQINNYKVTRNNEVVPVYAVNYDSQKNKAVLVFTDTLKAGEYTVKFQNITDNSMNENKLKKSVRLNIQEKPALSKTWNMKIVLIVCGSLIFVSILIVAIFCVRKKRKKAPNVKETDSLLAQSTLDFVIRGETETKNVSSVIKDRLTVGRSSECDITLSDPLLSRNHFVIEKDEGNFYITNLSNTNGTKLNGVEINDRCKLKNGDVVQAGTLHITITL